MAGYPTVRRFSGAQQLHSFHYNKYLRLKDTAFDRVSEWLNTDYLRVDSCTPTPISIQSMKIEISFPFMNMSFISINFGLRSNPCIYVSIKVIFSRYSINFSHYSTSKPVYNLHIRDELSTPVIPRQANLCTLV